MFLEKSLILTDASGLVSRSAIMFWLGQLVCLIPFIIFTVGYMIYVNANHAALSSFLRVKVTIWLMLNIFLMIRVKRWSSIIKNHCVMLMFTNKAKPYYLPYKLMLNINL